MQPVGLANTRISNYAQKSPQSLDPIAKLVLKP